MEGVRLVREGRLVAGWPVTTAMRARDVGLQWGAGRGEGGGSLWENCGGGVESLDRGPQGRRVGGALRWRGAQIGRKCGECAWKGGRSWPSRSNGLRVLG